jgi:hypothetical protein
MTDPPPFKPVHPDTSLSRAKLDGYDKLSTQELIHSLRPGQPGSLKARGRMAPWWTAITA